MIKQIGPLRQASIEQDWADIINLPPDETRPRPRYTYGFTLDNVAELIGKSLADEGLLGWFIHLYGRNTTVQRVSVTGMILNYENENPVLRFSALDTDSGAGFRHSAKFRTVRQYSIPDFSYYNGPHGVTRPSLIQMDASELRGMTDWQMRNTQVNSVTVVDFHTDWAEAVFFRRADIKMLQLLLLANVNHNQPEARYNDLFFSGARVNFGDMNNPLLRVQQFTQRDGNNDLVENSGIAFSLKVEPFHNDLDGGLLSGDALVRALYQNPNALSSSISPEPAPLAASTIGAPCPDFWGATREITTNLNLQQPAQASIIERRISEEVADISANQASSPVAREIQLGNVVDLVTDEEPRRSLWYRVVTGFIKWLKKIRGNK